MTRQELFLAYLRHYEQKDLVAIGAMLADEVTLRDWHIAVVGKAAALDQTRINFDSAQSIRITVLDVYEAPQGVAGELRIDVDDRITLFVVDVVAFDDNGKIRAIRAYLGRGGD